MLNRQIQMHSMDIRYESTLSEVFTLASLYHKAFQHFDAKMNKGHGSDNDDDHFNNGEEDRQTGLLVAPAKPELKKPKMYKVFLLNDDYTTMDFVIMILQHVFFKTRDEAVHIMLQVHQNGKGVCGTYSKDIAETKVQQVLELAKENGHPLQCIMQPD